MTNSQTIPSLMFFTLGAVVLIVAVLLVLHLRKRRNRHPMENVRERNIDEIRRGKQPEREG